MSEVLVEVTRGDLVECCHRGYVAVVNSQGELVYSVGDPYHISYWRSSAKPIQAIPVVESGAMERYGITLKELALFCASHSGEDFHVEGVLGVLKKIDIAPEELRCGSHMPYNKKAEAKLLEKGLAPSNLHCNCSGKHSGMLVVCQQKNYPLDDYTLLEHPLQQELLDLVGEFCNYPKEKIIIGIDGCGVPVYGLPIYNWALAYAYLADPTALEEKRRKTIEIITNAMTDFPEMVGGTDRLCTDLMKVGKGNLIAKAGAEGVYCVGIKDQKLGIAVKMEDGSPRGRAPVVIEVLKQLGALNEEELAQLKNYHYPENRNHRRDLCGMVTPKFTLKKVLA
ncbi:asparaginase [Anaerobranca californiensis DSM 14826]|jgi:L-asparaginase II|uniref:Asparaginase n=1 Tax=Anaerobranca californiensis DSM 14826 TaxID=1120989 RepID=A0A1M6QQT9_9FIRM|nr:asparaginase [Anaerobranca californiensis]SHK22566.1 asparaginase [Anaerobranca californiensis DSM 14826]